jgi:hypothetical protein
MDLGNLASEEGRHMEVPHDLIQKGAYSICGVEIPVLLVPTVLSCKEDYFKLACKQQRVQITPH